VLKTASSAGSVSPESAELHIVFGFTEVLIVTSGDHHDRYVSARSEALGAQLRAGPLVSHVDAFEQYRDAHQYAAATSKTHLGCLAHVGYRMTCCRLVAEDLDEDRVEQFLDEHLPQCDCPVSAPFCRARPDLQAALGHLLHVLRTKGVIPERMSNETPVDVELCRFDAHMDPVRGLAPGTRRFYLHLVGRLLREQFDTARIDVATITPQVLRRSVDGCGTALAGR
jgi:integrase/recombinase XerC